MRENRPCGSEGGEAAPFLPLSNVNSRVALLRNPDEPRCRKTGGHSGAKPPKARPYEGFARLLIQNRLDLYYRSVVIAADPERARAGAVVDIDAADVGR